MTILVKDKNMAKVKGILVENNENPLPKKIRMKQVCSHSIHGILIPNMVYEDLPLDFMLDLIRHGEAEKVE